MVITMMVIIREIIIKYNSTYNNNTNSLTECIHNMNYLSVQKKARKNGVFSRQLTQVKVPRAMNLTGNLHLKFRVLMHLQLQICYV